MKPPMKKTTPPTRSRQSPKVTPAKPPVPGSMPLAAEDMHWKAKNALSTLKEAHQIKNDPHLMEHVKKHAAVEREALKKVIGRKG